MRLHSRIMYLSAVRTKKSGYYTSARLYDYDGLFNYNSDTYRTMNMRTKISAQVFNWLKISNNIDYTHDKYTQPLGYAEAE